MPLERWRTANRLAVPILLALVIGAFFHKTLLGERFYLIDFFQTFVPLRTVLADAWSHGLPFWTGRLGNGAPVLANPAYGVIYLPNLVYLGVDPARSMTALTVAHFIGGGLGAWLLARRWDMSRAASWTAGVTFALGGAAVSSTAYPNLSWPLAWLPWALVAQKEATDGRRWRGIAGLAVAWASMLSMGDPVVVAAAITGSGLVAFSDLAPMRAGRSFRTWLDRSMVPLGAAGLLSLIFASPMLVAVARYFPHSVRAAGFKAAGIVLWSLHPLLLVGFILPDPYGDPGVYGGTGFWATALAPDRGRPLLAGLYVGGLTVALAILGALRRSPHRVVLLGWLGLLVALALGRYGPIYPVAGDLNGFDALRFPTKWIVPAMLPLALLAASGLDALGAGVRKGPAVLLAVLGLLAMASVSCMLGLERMLASLAYPSNLPIDGIPLALHVRSTILAAAARSAAPLGLALLVLVVRPRMPSLSMILPIIAALLSLDLILANGHLAPTIAGEFYEVPRAATVILRDPNGHGRVFVDDAAIDARMARYLESPRSSQEVARALRSCLGYYVGASAGLSLTFNADIEAFSPLAYARAGALVRSAPLREKLMLLGAAGVTHIVTFQPTEGPLSDPIATIPGTLGLPLLVYRNPFALPRARIVPRLTPYDADAGFVRAVESGPDDLFRRTALVERRMLVESGQPPDAASAESGTAAVVAEDGRSLNLATDGPGGFLIVSDTLVPGWTAMLDGAPAPLVPVDLEFRAVPVPAGSHRVEMTYSPW